MTAHEYHFVTCWKARATLSEIDKVFEDPKELPRWWPSVYLHVEELRRTGGDGVGSEYDLYTKGWLPYTLRWRFRVLESRRPHGYTIEAFGDFVGRGVWSFQEDGDHVTLTYDWRVRAEKPLLRWLSFLLKPVFAANHRWAMSKGEESLTLELARRRATTDEERLRVPGPPGPTFTALVRRPLRAGAS